MNKTLQIALIGFAGPEEYSEKNFPPNSCFTCAEKIGREIGKKGWYLITGGKSGVMEASARGCKSAGGVTIGVVCGQTRGSSNRFTDIEVVANTYPTGEESLLISMADIVIVCGGGAGTLQEICIAYRLGKPIIIVSGTGGWADRLSGEFLDERKRTPLLRVNSPGQCISACDQIMNEMKGGEYYGNRKK